MEMSVNAADELDKFLDKEGIDDFISSFDDLPHFNDILSTSLSGFDELGNVSDDLNGLSYQNDNKYLETLLSENHNSSLVCPAPQLMVNDISLNGVQGHIQPSQPHLFPTKHETQASYMNEFLLRETKHETSSLVGVYGCNAAIDSCSKNAANNGSASNTMTEAECKLMLIRRLTECDSSSSTDFAEVLLNAASQLRGADKTLNGTHAIPQQPIVTECMPTHSAPVSSSLQGNSQFVYRSNSTSQGRILPRPVQCIAPAPSGNGSTNFNSSCAKLDSGIGGGRLPVTAFIVSGPQQENNQGLAVVTSLPTVPNSKGSSLVSSSLSSQTGGPLRQLILKSGPNDSNVVRVLAPSSTSTPNQLLQPIGSNKTVISSDIPNGGAATVYINALPLPSGPIQQPTQQPFQPNGLSEAQPTITSISVSPRLANEIGIRGQLLPTNQVYGTMASYPNAPAGSGGNSSGGTGRRSQQHNVIEKRYRMSINEKIDELRQMLPDDDSKGNKSAVLKRAIEYISCLKRENEHLKHELTKYHQQFMNGQYETHSPDYGSNGFQQRTPSFSDSSPSANFSERELESPSDMTFSTTSQIGQVAVTLPGKRTFNGGSSYAAENNKIPRLMATDQLLNGDSNGQGFQSTALASRGVVMLAVFALLVFSPMDYLMGPYATKPYSGSGSSSSVMGHPTGTSRRLFSWEVLRNSPTFSLSTIPHVLLFWSLLILQWFLAILLCIWSWHQRQVQHRKSLLTPERMESTLKSWQTEYAWAKENIRIKNWFQAYERLQLCRATLGYSPTISIYDLAMDIICNILVNIPLLKHVVSQNILEDNMLRKAYFASETLRMELLALGRVREQQGQIISLCLHLWNACQCSIYDIDLRLECLFTIYALVDRIEIIPHSNALLVKKVIWKRIIRLANTIQRSHTQKLSSWGWLFSSLLSDNNHLLHWENMDFKEMENDYLNDYFTGSDPSSTSISARMQAMLFIHGLEDGLVRVICDPYNEQLDFIQDLVHLSRYSPSNESQCNIRWLWCLVLRDIATSKSLELLDSNVFSSCEYAQKLKDDEPATELGRLIVPVLSLLDKNSHQQPTLSFDPDNQKAMISDLLEMQANVDQFVTSTIHSASFECSNSKRLFMNIVCCIYYLLLKAHLELFISQRQQQFGSHLENFYCLLTKLESVLKTDQDLYSMWSHELFIMKKRLRELAQANPMKTTNLVQRYHWAAKLNSSNKKKQFNHY